MKRYEGLFILDTSGSAESAAKVTEAVRKLIGKAGGKVEAGTIFMNRCDCLDPALPWTGLKASGKGSSLSRYGLLAMTRPKAIHFRTQF